MTTRVVAMVPSLSSREHWAVRRDEADQWSCECPRGSFAKKGGDAPCRHVEIAKAAMALVKRCEHVEGEALCVACLVSVLAAAARKVRGEVATAYKTGKAEVREKLKARRAKQKA